MTSAAYRITLAQREADRVTAEAGRMPSPDHIGLCYVMQSSMGTTEIIAGPMMRYEAMDYIVRARAQHQDPFRALGSKAGILWIKALRGGDGR